jgi:hypothetical protein
MERFHALLKQKKISVVYKILEHLGKWEIISFWSSGNDLSEIIDVIPLNHCKRFVCKYGKLSRLPDTLSECTFIDCSNNQLEELPNNWGNCLEIDCSNNKLTELPNNLYKCERLNCKDNKLTKLPNCLDECKIVVCLNNQLEYLSPLKKCEYLWCENNYLFSDSINDWILIWRARSNFISRKIFYLWKRIVQNRRCGLRFQCLKSINKII